MTRSASSALPPLLALALLAPVPARAGELPPGAETEPEKPASAPPDTAALPPPDAPAPEAAAAAPPARADTWIDASHSFIEQRVFAPILRLDRFFSDERTIEADRERSFLRWRSEVRFTEGSTRPTFTTGVRATLKLPGLDERLKRLRLVIEGETRDAVDRLFPRSPTPGSPPESQVDDDTTGGGDAGLRYFLFDTLAYHADLGGGVLVQLPPGAYGRLRFRWTLPVGDLVLSRLALVGFWRSDVKFGTTATVELDRPLWRALLLRLSGSGTRSQRSNGIEWESDLAALVPLPPRSGAEVGVSLTGATDATVVAPDPATGVPRDFRAPALDRTRAYARLRTDVYRGWLFVELEPEIAWPWTPARGRYSAWGLALRVEVQFQGKEAPPDPPPRAAPEPKDPPEPPPGSSDPRGPPS